MRITQNTLMNRSAKDLQQAMEKLAESQRKVSSGRAWHRASDDPTALRSAASYQSQYDRLAQYRRNLSRANGRLSYAESALNEAGNVYTRVSALAVQGANATTGAEDRRKIAEEVGMIRSHLLQLANTELEGQHLFGGGQIANPPYVAESDGVIDYRGDSTEMQIQVTDADTVSFNIPGESIFGNASEGVFHTLGALEEALRTDDVAGIQSSLGELETQHEALLTARSKIGARMNYLDALEEGFSAAQQELTVAISDVEDVDLAEAITEFARYDNQYQATASATARLLRTSILDYLA